MSNPPIDSDIRRKHAFLASALLYDTELESADWLQQLAHLNNYEHAPKYGNEPKTVVQFLCNCFYFSSGYNCNKNKIQYFYFSFIAVVATAKIK